MKKSLLLVIAASIFLACNTPGTRKDFVSPNSQIDIPADYTFQKTFTLSQNFSGFLTGYRVFEIGEKRYAIKKNPSLTETSFTISNLKTDAVYKIDMQTFQQIINDREIPPDGRIFTISQGTTQVATVTQTDVEDFFKLQLLYRDQVLDITGAIGRKFNNYHNLAYRIGADSTEYASFYKKFHYFINTYEIRINEEHNLLEDEIIIAINVIVDTMAQKYGFLYKN